jgi:hypothetical protein
LIRERVTAALLRCRSAPRSKLKVVDRERYIEVLNKAGEALPQQSPLPRVSVSRIITVAAIPATRGKRCAFCNCEIGNAIRWQHLFFSVRLSDRYFGICRIASPDADKPIRAFPLGPLDAYLRIYVKN